MEWRHRFDTTGAKYEVLELVLSEEEADALAASWHNEIPPKPGDEWERLPDDLCAGRGFVGVETPPLPPSTSASGYIRLMMRCPGCLKCTRGPMEWEKVIGKWPGQESDAEVAEALEVLS